MSHLHINFGSYHCISHAPCRCHSHTRIPDVPKLCPNMGQVAMECPSGTEQKPSLPDAAPPSLVESPYAKIVALRFADQVLHIHKFLLAKSGRLSVAASTQDEINMTDVSGATGHVLVHYLYTGDYNTNASTKSVSGAELLRSSLETYAVAKKYQLSDLSYQTQHDIESRSVDLDPSKALAIVKKTCPLPDAGDLWFRDYTKALLARTYTDVAAFLSSDLMATDAAESTMSITEMLLRAVISSVQEKEKERHHIEPDAQERSRREKMVALNAERDALEARKIKKGKLTRRFAQRLEMIKAELASLTPDDDPERAADSDEPDMELVLVPAESQPEPPTTKEMGWPTELITCHPGSFLS
ncbi:BTB/POZ domain-containing protein 3/6 [Microdochium nivale]|nr:BTB/POZ domain-containing protein 3/6 [Microdochium nivale]